MVMVMALIIYHELENSSSTTHNLLAEFQWPRQFLFRHKGHFLGSRHYSLA